MRDTSLLATALSPPNDSGEVLTKESANGRHETPNR